MTTWIIERNINEACESVAQTAILAGHRVVRWDTGDTIPHPEGQCIFLGSLTMCPTMPGVVGDPRNLEVTAWIGALEHLVLNKKRLFLTVSQIGPSAVPNNWDPVFVRPDSCMKPFAGRVLPRDNLSPAALDFGFYYDDPKLVVVLSPAQQVLDEWRFVAHNRQIIAYSGYSAATRSTTTSNPPSLAFEVAEEAARLSPEPTVVIDVCQVPKGTYHLVEYNLFSGSDLYGCNPHDIVKAISR